MPQFRDTLAGQQGLSSSATRPSSFDVRDRLLTISHHCIDISTLAILLIAPLALGGRHPIGRMTLIVAALPGSVGMLLKALSGRKIPLSRLQLVLMACCMLVPIIQVTPLPENLVRLSSPGVQNLFGDDPALTSLPKLHQTLSLSTATTRKALPICMAYLCIFLFLSYRIENLKDIERSLKILASAAVILALLALLQAKFGNGKFLWAYDHPSRAPGEIPRGPFQNENHFASLLAISLPCILYFLFNNTQPLKTTREFQENRSLGQPQKTTLREFTPVCSLQWAAAGGSLLIVLTVIATPSRGGAAIIAAAAAIWIITLGWSRIGKQRENPTNYRSWMNTGIALGCCASLCGIALMYRYIENFSYWRFKIWQTDIAIWKEFPILGVGVGNHRHIYRAYLDEYWHQTFSTGESSWLQLLVETGFLGVLLAVVIITAILRSATRAVSTSVGGTQLSLCAAVLAGLAASLLHASGDFPWHIPACIVGAMVLATAAIRLPSLTQKCGMVRDNISFPSNIAFSTVITAILLVGNCWATVASVPEVRASITWDAYRRLVRMEDSSDTTERDAQAKQLLAATLAHDPSHIAARTKHLCRMTADFEKQRFSTAEPLKQARQILLQANALVALCPTESNAHLCAAVAASAMGAPLEQQDRLLTQAQRLRPVDGGVALRRGLIGIVTQNKSLTDEQFEIALNADPAFRDHAVKALSLMFPPEEIAKRWQPCRDTCELLYQRVRKPIPDQQQRMVGTFYIRRLLQNAADTDNKIAKEQFIIAASTIAQEIKDQQMQIYLIGQRIKLHPYNVPLLLSRATLHYQNGEIEQARKDADRCAKIAPQNRDVRRFALRLDESIRKVRR